RFNLADYEGAFRECQAELRINSEHADAYTLLGRVAIVLARPEIAIGALQAAMRLRPDDALVGGLLARALVVGGRYAEATAVARRAGASDAAFQRDNPAEGASEAAAPDGPVTIGFLSNVFHKAPTRDIFRSWFQLRKKHAVAFKGYQQSVVKDTVTSTIKNGC